MHFAGRYARVFTDACCAESDDRGRLSRVCYELSVEVEGAKRQAARERERERALVAWQEREADRERRALTDPLDVVAERFADPQPSDLRVPRPRVRAVFAAVPRPRSAGGGKSGTSSADPQRLRGFVRQVRGSDAVLQDQLTVVSSAWRAFTASCGWVVVESATFLAGFERYLEENRADAAWIERVAAAFEAAGGGSLPDRALHALRPAPQALGAGELGATLKALKGAAPAEVAELWGELTVDARRQLTGLDPVTVGNLEGIPYADRDAANVSRLASLQEEVRGDLEADPQNFVLQDRLKAIRFLMSRFNGGKGRKVHPPVYLVAVDTTVAGAPLAAISVGDLDRAKNATFFVPGMNSSLLGAEDELRLCTNLQQQKPDHAVLLFLNYQSPSPLEVQGNRSALNGAERLEAMLNGYNAARVWSGLDSRLNVVAHSYGTTVATSALEWGDYGVDSVTLVASAGALSGISASTLHVDPRHVFVTQAATDQLATFGRRISGRSNPNDRQWGGRRFGSDGTTLPDGTQLDRVDGHNPIGPDAEHDAYRYFGGHTESLRNILAIIDGRYAELTHSEHPPQDPHPSPAPSPGAEPTPQQARR